MVFISVSFYLIVCFSFSFIFFFLFSIFPFSLIFIFFLPFFKFNNPSSLIFLFFFSCCFFPSFCSSYFLNISFFFFSLPLFSPHSTPPPHPQPPHTSASTQSCLIKRKQCESYSSSFLINDLIPTEGMGL